MLKINLGCSDQFLEGFVGVDAWTPPWATDQNFVKADLRRSWPFGSGCVDHVRAWDIIEHMPDPIHTMNELYRVLKPGGTAEIVVPTTDGRGAWQDPTHVSFWNRNSFFYYEDGNPHLTRFRDSNGVKCAFKILREHTERLVDDVVKLYIVLAAVKEVALEDQFLQVDSEAIA